MSKVPGLRVVAALAATLCPAALVLGYPQGPPADRVNLCSARLSCAYGGCHDSYPPNSGTTVTSLALETGPLPATYKTGELLKLVLSALDTDPSRQRFGFQIAAVSGCPFPAAAGTATLTDAGRTQLVTAPGGLEFVGHACNDPGQVSTCGYLPTPGPGQNSWPFDWQAPATYQGPITFYWAVNAADGNGFPDNDFVTLAQATLAPNCPGRIATLKAVERACDGGAPGAPRVELVWDAEPYAVGYQLYRTTDATALADPAALGATPLAGACDDPPAGPAVHFYSVVGICSDLSEGPA